jgi:hypothetical protein
MKLAPVHHQPGLTIRMVSSPWRRDELGLVREIHRAIEASSSAQSADAV